MINYRPIIGITMGDPVGVGPEIIPLALINPSIYEICRPIVIGDIGWLQVVKRGMQSDLRLRAVESSETGLYQYGCIDIINCSKLDLEHTLWGKPTSLTGNAMVTYITSAIDMALQGSIDAIVTCPINKKAMYMAGFIYNGHTELLAEKTKSTKFAMMLAGDRLRVVLVTIHIPLKDVPAALSKEKIFQTIEITDSALKIRFGLENPRIAVAGLNPHAGEGGIFGDEEESIILPDINLAINKGIDVSGPFPPDTIFYHAQKGLYDAVICMYHDQGLIPFKMIHFTDGVNTTLGLPIIRTSVDHGTAYDIAGRGKANPGSLIAAIKMATSQAIFTSKRK